LQRFLVEVRWRLFSSVIAEIEVRRAAGRYRRAARAREILSKVTLLELDPDVVDLASSLEPLSLGSLDAIHLSSALVFGGELQPFVTYDTRLAAAAGAAGLEVVSPS
jgi:uncharacterized protein